VPDRHLRLLSDAARTAARRLQDHRAAADSDGADDRNRDGELERTAARTRRRFIAAVRRRATMDDT